MIYLKMVIFHSYLSLPEGILDDGDDDDPRPKGAPKCLRLQWLRRRRWRRCNANTGGTARFCLELGS